MRKTGIRTTGVLAMVALGSALTMSVPARQYTWTGSGADNHWANAGNWMPVGVPGTDAEVAVHHGSVFLTNETAELASFTMTGGTLMFSNWTTRLRATEIEIRNGTLTLPPAFRENQMSNRIWMICSNLTVGTAATMDADQRGYLRGQGPGSSTATFGGSHGGRGAASESGWIRPEPYGSLSQPTEPGSGGWSTIGDGGASSGHGGGAIRIDATGHVEIHGVLSANGMPQGDTHASGGSGGSILINCRAFSGSATGLLSARGGHGTHRGSAGGGGRIAVVYDPAAQAQTAPGNPDVRFRAAPGIGGSYPHTAEAGTVYLPDTAFLTSPMRAAQWQGVNVYAGSLATHWEVSELQIDGRIAFPQLETLQVAGNLRINDGGRLTLFSHPTNIVDAHIGFRLDVGGTLSVEDGGKLVLFCDPETGGAPYIECGNLVLQSGGLIDADGRGFGAMIGPSSSTSERQGGGYGGASAAPGPEPVSGVAYAPMLPGSGGGDAAAGGRGGGFVRIGARNRMILDGTISANGHERVSIHRGGGAGGGILLSADRIEGAGALRANGGNSSHEGRAGGGGRIALWRPFLPPSFFRDLAARPLPGNSIERDPARDTPNLTMTVDPGTGGYQPERAGKGTLFFGFMQFGTLVEVRYNQ